MSLAILCDFDDTTADQNVAHLVLNEFGPQNWRELIEQFHQGKIAPKEYFEAPFRNLTTEKSVLQAHVRKFANLRAGFLTLANFCKDNSVELGIVTYGLDFYVEALLQREDLEWIPTFSVGTQFSSSGIKFDYNYTRDDCSKWGNCKCSIVEQYQESGHRVYYAGDGISDFCPARKTDLVFARSGLLEMCKKENLRHIELHDFFEVTKHLEKEIIGENND